MEIQPDAVATPGLQTPPGPVGAGGAPGPAAGPVELIELPTAALRRIFALLPPASRLALGCVCRRLAELALEPAQWSTISLGGLDPTLTDNALVSFVNRSRALDAATLFHLTELYVDGCQGISHACVEAIIRFCMDLKVLSLVAACERPIDSVIYAGFAAARRAAVAAHPASTAPLTPLRLGVSWLLSGAEETQALVAALAAQISAHRDAAAAVEAPLAIEALDLSWVDPARTWQPSAEQLTDVARALFDAQGPGAAAPLRLLDMSGLLSHLPPDAGLQSAVACCAAARRSLEFLSLSANNMRSEGLESLSAALCDAPKLLALCLMDNPLAVAEAQAPHASWYAP